MCDVSPIVFPGLKPVIFTILLKSFNTTWEDFASYKRNPENTCSRYCFFYYLKVIKNMRYSEIEQKTGADHASARYGVERVKAVLNDDYNWPFYGKIIKAVIAEIIEANPLLNSLDLYDFHETRDGIHCSGR